MQNDNLFLSETIEIIRDVGFKTYENTYNYEYCDISYTE